MQINTFDAKYLKGISLPVQVSALGPTLNAPIPDMATPEPSLITQIKLGLITPDSSSNSPEESHPSSPLSRKMVLPKLKVPPP